MDPFSAATRVPDPDAVEFIRFCYGRRRVGWPELYDEMCGVAARGLFRGLGADDLAAHGIGFGLFDMPALAAMAAGVVAQEQALRRPVTVVIDPVPDLAVVAELEVLVVAVADTGTTSSEMHPVADDPIRSATEPGSRSEAPVRFAAVPAGA